MPDSLVSDQQAGAETTHGFKRWVSCLIPAHLHWKQNGQQNGTMRLTALNYFMMESHCSYLKLISLNEAPLTAI